MKPATTLSTALLLVACEGASGERQTVVEELIAAAVSPAGGWCPEVTPLGPEVLSTSADEGRLTVTPDGQTAYFHRLDERNILTIMESHRTAGGWSAPVVAPFSGVHDDLDPFVSADGTQLWFSSFRPVTGAEPRPDAEIWILERQGSSWGEPVHLGPAINSPYHELFPSTTRDGTLFFNTNRAAPSPSVWDGWDIYSARLKGGDFAAAERLDAGINTVAFWEFNPSPSPDGSLLVFASLNRPDGLGGTDLYVSIRWRGRWLPARNLSPCVNTAADEYHPMVTPARHSLIFVRASADPPTGGDFFELGPGSGD